MKAPNVTRCTLLIAVVSGAGFSAPSQAGLTELRQRYESGACNHDQDRMVEDLRAYRRQLWHQRTAPGTASRRCWTG